MRVQADAAVLAAPATPYGRALYLYLEQEYPEKHRPGGRRFDHAERVQVMNRQWRSEAYSSHYRGPLGPTPKLDDGNAGAHQGEDLSCIRTRP